MKTFNIVSISELIISLFLISCDPESNTNRSDSEFKVEFSDSTLITEDNLLFYDSSTYLLFLKRDFEFNQSMSGFNVFVDNDTIYQGIIYPCVLSAPPPSPYYILDCFIYGYDIIEIGCYGESNDLRNDQRIISALKNSNLLLNGITCRIDSIKVNSFSDYSEVTCTIIIKNNDTINYYILDPQKMGELEFNYFTGGISFQNIETRERWFLRWSVPADWDNITINDFSVLEGNSELTYTFKSSDYHKIGKGIYKAQFRFCGTEHETPEFDLNQENGRIWVGDAAAVMDSILVE